MLTLISTVQQITTTLQKIDPNKNLLTTPQIFLIMLSIKYLRKSNSLQIALLELYLNKK